MASNRMAMEGAETATTAATTATAAGIVAAVAIAAGTMAVEVATNVFRL